MEIVNKKFIYLLPMIILLVWILAYSLNDGLHSHCGSTDTATVSATKNNIFTFLEKTCEKENERNADIINVFFGFFLIVSILVDGLFYWINSRQDS